MQVALELCCKPRKESPRLGMNRLVPGHNPIGKVGKKIVDRRVFAENRIAIDKSARSLSGSYRQVEPISKQPFACGRGQRRSQFASGCDLANRERLQMIRNDPKSI